MKIIFKTKAQSLECLVGDELEIGAYFEIKPEDCFIHVESIDTVVVGDDVAHITMLSGKVFDVPTTDWLAYMESK